MGTLPGGVVNFQIIKAFGCFITGKTIDMTHVRQYVKGLNTVLGTWQLAQRSTLITLLQA